MNRTARVLCALWLGFALGCAHHPLNPQLARFDGVKGYRYSTVSSPDNSDSLLVVLAFSGGGTRAAALSYGVLQQLAKTKIYWEGRERSLLSEVDVIASVSGGSFTAAYYALFGDRIFKDFEARFLDQPVQTSLVHRLFNPWNWYRMASPYFDRIDMAAEYYDQTIFEHKTYADLIAKGTKPFLIVNATDLSRGVRFEFTQDAFDPICSDLAGVPIARAVAASSAFPGLLSPLTLQDFSHANPCKYSPPEWLALAGEDRDVNARRFAKGERLSSYLNGQPGAFIHLIDGGVSDNIGLRGPLDALTSNDSALQLVNRINSGEIKKVLVITVNAKTGTLGGSDASERAPGLLKVFKTAAETPMGDYSFETVELLNREFDERDRARRNVEACQSVLDKKCDGVKLPGGPRPKLDYFRAEVAFDALANPAQRNAFLSLPTTFELPPATVHCLEEVGASLLAESPGFKAMLGTLDAEAKAAHVAPPVRTPESAAAWPCPGMAGK